MDRSIVYPGSIPLDTDLLASNRNTMVALGALIQAVLGTATAVDGLAVGPSAPASLAVSVAPGSISQLATVDAAAYGSLAADTATPLVKMGVNTTASTLTLAAPGTAGQSVVWLIQASLLESDINPVVLPYYNAANPSVAFLGPANSGTAQPTLRAQRVQVQARQGVPAATGSQLPPAVDAGWTGLALVTIAYGQTQITSGNITAMTSAPVVPFKLPALRPGFSQQQVLTASGSFSVPAGVTRLRVRRAGGGGGGGGCLAGTGAGGGGGAGGAAEGIYAVTPGSSYSVTVGAGGAGGAVTAGTTAGSGTASSFGALISAGGGTGGQLQTPNFAGGPPGNGAGGSLNLQGGDGCDGSASVGIASALGGASLFGGGGRAGAGGGMPGRAPGSGGGGAYATNAVGGAGAAGVVIVEW